MAFIYFCLFSMCTASYYLHILLVQELKLKLYVGKEINLKN